MRSNVFRATRLHRAPRISYNGVISSEGCFPRDIRVIVKHDTHTRHRRASALREEPQPEKKKKNKNVAFVGHADYSRSTALPSGNRRALARARRDAK